MNRFEHGGANIEIVKTHPTENFYKISRRFINNDGKAFDYQFAIDGNATINDLFEMIPTKEKAFNEVIRKEKS